MREAANPQDVTVEVKFPSIIQGDEQERIASIVNAMTMGGYECIGIDFKTGIGLLLTELGVEDVEEVLDEMFPEGTYDPNRSDLLAAQKDQKLNPPEPMVKKPTEAGLAKAVGALQRAAKQLHENGHAHN